MFYPSSLCSSSGCVIFTRDGDFLCLPHQHCRANACLRLLILRLVAEERFGRVQSVTRLPRVGSSGDAATIAFVDIRSASKAHLADHHLEGRSLKTTYYEPSSSPNIAVTSARATSSTGDSGSPRYVIPGYSENDESSRGFPLSSDLKCSSHPPPPVTLLRGSSVEPDSSYPSSAVVAPASSTTLRNRRSPLKSASADSPRAVPTQSIAGTRYRLANGPNTPLSPAYLENNRACVLSPSPELTGKTTRRGLALLSYAFINISSRFWGWSCSLFVYLELSLFSRFIFHTPPPPSPPAGLRLLDTALAQDAAEAQSEKLLLKMRLHCYRALACEIKCVSTDGCVTQRRIKDTGGSNWCHGSGSLRSVSLQVEIRWSDAMNGDVIEEKSLVSPPSHLALTCTFFTFTATCRSLSGSDSDSRESSPISGGSSRSPLRDTGSRSHSTSSGSPPRSPRNFSVVRMGASLEISLGPLTQF
ncbi:unnamed protein product [Cyprideis torosa]|uniref:Uncharacterized protein n=1 Tax=Cyprideis torosa TaxID=163714 RepID=A0A7R8W5Y5_9CRUS|nr:unnamed protein product [Cyprideis torosa]CAG0885770.1 unnamed protein product [Cyprideis torosa]